MLSGLLLMTLGLARADDPVVAQPPAPAAQTAPTAPDAQPPAADPGVVPNEEITVWGERVKHARGELDHSLRAYGYHQKRVRNGFTVYGRSGKDRWKPKLLVNDDGVVMFRNPRILVQSPVLVGQPSLTSEMAPGFADSASGQPDRGSLSFGFPVVVPRKRIQNQEQGRVMDAIGDDLHAWRQALDGQGEATLLQHLPETLDAIWQKGLDPDGRDLPDAAARRAALIDLWASRADTPAGVAARGMIADYLTEVVQSSPTPLSEAELARARELGIPIP